jgi:hypothetical protein
MDPYEPYRVVIAEQDIIEQVTREPVCQALFESILGIRVADCLLTDRTFSPIAAH